MVVCAIALVVQGAGHSSQVQRLGRVHRADRDELSDTRHSRHHGGREGREGIRQGLWQGLLGRPGARVDF